MLNEQQQQPSSRNKTQEEASVKIMLRSMYYKIIQKRIYLTHKFMYTSNGTNFSATPFYPLNLFNLNDFSHMHMQAIPKDGNT